MFSSLCASACLLVSLLNGVVKPTPRRSEVRGQPRWRRVPVRVLGNVPPGATDSVITVRERDDHHIIVMYTFDNPCGDRVIARTRQANDTIAVRFTIVSRTPTSRPELTPACSATIEHRTYAVDVGRSATDTVVIRSMYGRGSTWVNLPQRVVYGVPSQHASQRAEEEPCARSR